MQNGFCMHGIPFDASLGPKEQRHGGNNHKPNPPADRGTRRRALKQKTGRQSRKPYPPPPPKPKTSPPPKTWQSKKKTRRFSAKYQKETPSPAAAIKQLSGRVEGGSWTHSGGGGSTRGSVAEIPMGIDFLPGIFPETSFSREGPKISSKSRILTKNNTPLENAILTNAKKGIKAKL